jgi:DGQHR domain-containing protein
MAQRVRLVEIDFPYRHAAFDAEKPAILVDGQQRTAALALVDVDKMPSFFLSVNAVVADEEEAKRVFRVANSTVKISTQFSRALLASMGEAPGYLLDERTKALAARTLALTDKTSPFKGRVQYPGSTQKTDKPIAYNSLFQVVATFADSALPLDKDPAALSATVSRSFNLVREMWPTAWDKKPLDSRLVHGVGLRAIGDLLVGKLEALYASHGSLTEDALWQQLRTSLGRLQPRLVWTDAEVVDASPAVRKTYREQIANRQNTSQDIAFLTTYLKKESLSLDSKATKAGE